MRKLTSLIFAFTVMVLPVKADISDELLRLSNALGLPEVIEVMRVEGIAYGDELAESMFPGQGGHDWKVAVEGIYSAENMEKVAINGFAENLPADNIALLLEFFESNLGEKIISLEISARLALMDDAVDEASTAHVAQMRAENDPRIELLTKFIEVNKLLESNVVGALNSNFAFITGLSEGGAYDRPLSESDMLREVWSQEADIRKDTNEWLYGFLSMAYSPLSAEELTIYIKLSETPEGQALNAALFAGFDELFDGISYELGFAAAQKMSGEEL